jgi:DNA polymerase-3 subunit gamma/tau
MENFVVSARKYRPATFESVVGQSHITTTLKNAIKNNHLAQSFLFCGPRGVGKTTNARILAKTINCENISTEIEACNICDSCRSFNENSSFNIHELDAASNNSVDDIRSLVDQVRYPPQGNGKYKIYIIDEVHMLSNAAFNAFLKTLEEPPKYAIFILATTEKHKIIPTILSRCQIFDFNRIQIKDISNHLQYIAQKENILAEPEALHLIAQKADGALRDALSIFDLIVTFSSDNKVTYKTTIENLHILDYDYYFRMTDCLHRQDIAQALLIYDEILKDGFDGHNFIVGLCEHFRNLMVCKDSITLKLLEVSEEVRKKYQDQANTASVSFLMSALNIASYCDLHFKSSKNQRIHVELALMKTGYLNSVIDLTREASLPEEVKKKPQQLENSQEKKDSTPMESAMSSEPNAVAPPDRIVIEKSERKSTLNLHDLKNLKNTINKVEVKEEKKTEVVTVDPVNDFSMAQLKSAWSEFAGIYKTEGKTSQFIILDREIELVGTTIRLKLHNLIQIDQLNAFKAELLDYIRKKLRNSAIALEATIAPEGETKQLYTSKEKFQHLASKYPLLDELKNKLGLETDF